MLLTELQANFTRAFCQNNDYERPAWFSLQNRGTQSVAANIFFFALREVMICNFADAKDKIGIIFSLREAK